MKKIIIRAVPSLDAKTLSKMTAKQLSRYLKVEEILFQLQILIKLLSPQIINKVQSLVHDPAEYVVHKRTYIATIDESFNYFVYTLKNSIYNLLRTFFPKVYSKKEIANMHRIPEIRRIIGKKGIRHIDVHVSSEGRYDTLGYFGTTMGKNYKAKLLALRAMQKEYLNEMNNIYSKVFGFTENILKKINAEIWKKAKIFKPKKK